MSQKLFSSFSLGSVTLPNRLVMAPMTRCRATPDHVPTDIMAEYYGMRASAGLLITEGTAPVANGAGYARIPGLWNQEQIDGWKKITDAVHAKGGRIAVQLMHTGRIGHPNNLPQGAQILAPSATRAPGEMYTDSEGMQGYPVAEEMNAAQIEEAIEGFVTASKNAVKAGFDLIELHGANGYLIEQFFAPNTNQRNDEFGGDVAGRGRFALEVARRCVEAVGAERVAIRLSPFGVASGIEPWDEIASDFVWLGTKLGELNLAYLHVADHSSMGAPPVPAEFKKKLQAAFAGPFILSGGYDQKRAEADLQEERGDMVAFGRPFISNPDLVSRLQEDKPLADPDMNTFYTPGEKGYTDYPVATD